MHWLVEGPRGRRLLWQLIASSAGPYGGALAGAGDVRSTVAAMEAAPSGDEDDLMQAFADSVSWARYWQEPDGTDAALSAAGGILSTVAEQVQLPGWWTAPAALDQQVMVTWSGSTPTLTGAAAKLQSWRTESLADEARAAEERPRDLEAPWSGRWWSTPAMSGLPATSRRLRDLWLVEDSMGWTSAAVTPVAPTRAVRVYEVHSPQEWTQLVLAYPLELTASRRHDWWRATRAREPLYVPDYAAAAREWDAVHVSARGYLTTATRALPVADGCTVLAGWNPDQTWWLTDCLEATGPTVREAVRS